MRNAVQYKWGNAGPLLNKLKQTVTDASFVDKVSTAL